MPHWYSRVFSWFSSSRWRSTADTSTIQSPPPPPYSPRDNHHQTKTGSGPRAQPYRTEVEQSKNCPADWRDKPANIVFTFASNTDNPTDLICPWGPWVAILEVRARDPVRLLGNGFFWSADNLQFARGQWVTHDHVPVSVRDHCYFAGCTWRLIDRACDPAIGLDRAIGGYHDEEQQWTAQLTVYADMNFISELPSFRFKDLNIERTFTVSVVSWDGEMVYWYHALWPWDNSNVLFDDGLPMSGAWPWPRANKGPDRR